MPRLFGHTLYLIADKVHAAPAVLAVELVVGGDVDGEALGVRLATYPLLTATWGLLRHQVLHQRIYLTFAILLRYRSTTYSRVNGYF
jgi:hypothetical protein